MIPIVSVVGKKKAGKTTLVVGLVAELAARGYKVGTIKHDAHAFEIDREGKDSYRHFHAGAAATVIASDERVAMVKRASAQPRPEDLASYFDPDTDIVITEGFKRSDLPKIEVYRRKEGDEGLLCRPEDGLVAVVADEAVETDRPVFGTSEHRRIADFVVERFRIRPSGLA